MGLTRRSGNTLSVPPCFSGSTLGTVLILSPRQRGYSSERAILKPSKRGLLIAPLRAQSPSDIPRAEFEREVTIVIVTVKSK